MPLEATPRPIKIAILAMGGEGGGVLADWIVATAEHAGFHAQSTSVPGVAQRTGATIYYVEVLPGPRDRTRTPVLGLMPVPGDVDVVIASELMEAARAVQRGLVTPDRTVLIASSNRVYALPEKMAMGDGRKDYASLYEAGRSAAREFICRDFSALAERSGSVISATLFGALAATGTLPWERQAFEAAIERGGIGVAASLQAFDAGFRAQAGASGPPSAPPPAETAIDARLAPLDARIGHEFPAPLQDILRAGIVRAADYQDPAYAALYLDRLRPLLDAARGADGAGARLLRETARYLALWMTYEDTVRVAELKIRATRFERVRQQHGARAGQTLRINEFFHPRPEEIADMLPAALGRWLLASRWAGPLLARATRGGRVVRTSGLRGFLLLYGVASFKRLRPRSLRQERETAGMLDWLDRVAQLAPVDYDLACEIAECPRLIKGYGDTHARGLGSYRKIIAVLPALLGRDDAARTVAGLREAALADDSGERLARRLADIEPAAHEV
ncbi:MAG: indolepyruvate oxidoreductase subunit beta family protein [Alcaligenaceae bacterium]|nr:indolepyruvate oxidoreductase subunit beta family protein [Alcaligenaceae bacterium SAGV5]MPS51944.1 indolepyruvate oxidoreductase subunit beta family protein [Alcaligenaceae bacterium SAGV3]MPT58409.1 indolepyruvate oxidoreductase subunit beta family protein [Alcaligenaceae bacterium]